MGLYDNETIWRHIQNDYCFMFKMALQLTTRMHTILQHSDTNRLKNYILSIKNHQRAIGDFRVYPLLGIYVDRHVSSAAIRHLNRMPINKAPPLVVPWFVLS